MKRRKILTVVGGLSAVGIVGCLGDGCVEETVADVWETVGAGQSLSWRAELEPGDQLEISAVQTGDGARPKLEVEGPNGTIMAEVGPAERIERTVTAQNEGRHYVRLVNEALVTSGQWDIDIEYRSADC